MTLTSSEQKLLDYAVKHYSRMLEELFDFLRIPSISNDIEFNSDIRHCAKWVASSLKKIGVQEPQVWETNGNPIVYGEVLVDPKLPTYLLYGHYDVQPPDPLEEWESKPFQPVVRDGKIFARGATDDKGQVFCHFKGLETHLALNKTLPVNVKILIEGEEEVGSPSLTSWVEEHAEMLNCDAIIVSDSSMYAPGKPSIMYGLRGLAYFEIEVTGPSHDLHSGLFGGAVENPIQALASIIAKLKDDTGRIQIPGFYDDVRDLTPTEIEAFAALDFDAEAYRESIGAKKLHGEEGFSTLARTWARPTLDCNGIVGGYIGVGAKTVLPSKASAKLSCRLVPDQQYKKIEKLVCDAIQAVAPDTVSVQVTLHHGGDPVLMELDHPAIRGAARALAKSWNTDPVFVRGGGSIPVVATFSEVLKAPTVLIGLGLDDDRLHSPNEKFDLENFYGGIRSSILLWNELAKV